MNENDTDLFMNWLVRADVEIRIEVRHEHYHGLMTSFGNSDYARTYGYAQVEDVLATLSDFALRELRETQGE